MRTKTLLLTAALGAVSIATSMAQVFSENSVGYYVRTLETGFNVVANQFNNGDNKLTTLIPETDRADLNNATLYKWDSVNQTFLDPDTYFAGGGWINSDFSGPSETTLEPGEGAFLKVEAATSITLVGEVPQGALGVAIPANFSLISQPTPQALALDAAGDEIPAGNNDQVLFWDAGAQGFEGAKTFFFDEGSGTGFWLENDFVTIADLSVGVGQGFFYNRSAANGATSWDRTFSVN